MSIEKPEEEKAVEGKAVFKLSEDDNGSEWIDPRKANKPNEDGSIDFPTDVDHVEDALEQKDKEDSKRDKWNSDTTNDNSRSRDHVESPNERGPLDF